MTGKPDLPAQRVNDPILRFTENEIAAWLDGAAKGEFGHLLATPVS